MRKSRRRASDHEWTWQTTNRAVGLTLAAPMVLPRNDSAQFSDTGWISIIPSVLWFVFALCFVIILRRRLWLVLDAIISRIQGGAPLGLGPLNIGSPPPALRSGELKSATAEGTSGVEAPVDVETMMIERRFPSEITDALYLVHVSQVITPYSGPGTGRWRVRVYVEAYDDDTLLRRIKRVTYRLHDTFNPKAISTEARDNAFELWMNIYGEFNLVAYVERDGDAPLWLTRYIDLPGRPTN